MESTDAALIPPGCCGAAGCPQTLSPGLLTVRPDSDESVHSQTASVDVVNVVTEAAQSLGGKKKIERFSATQTEQRRRRVCVKSAQK